MARCCWHRSQALESLRQAVMLGYADLDYMVNDPDLGSLHGDTDFQAIVTYLAGRDGAQHVI